MSRTPNKCYYKPERKKPRYWTAKKVAQVFCQAKADTGATEREFIDLCDCWVEPSSDCEELRKYIESILEALAAILLLITLPQGIVLRALLLLTRMLPAGLLGRMGIIKLLERLPSARAELERIIEGLRLRLPPP